jgi:putative aldouronate transport system permease protein
MVRGDGAERGNAGNPRRMKALKRGRNWPLYIMVLPGACAFFFLNYLPMAGILIAFKDMRFRTSSFFTNFFASKWVLFDNFEYLFKSPDALVITRNTLCYNLAFIAIGTVASVAFAIILDGLGSRRLVKFYQTTILLPYFLSWIALSYVLYAFLNPSLGFINAMVLKPLGVQPVSWYGDQRPWPLILVLMNLLKYAGYNTVIYLAAIATIDSSLYEAARMDGATEWRQVIAITVPLISPIIIVMTLLSVGRIFNADFGLFFQVPMESGALFGVTNVIDTYVFRALRQTGDFGMASAAGLYQSVLGFACILAANALIRKVDRERALF